jgi:hypothetical protein
VLDLAVGNRVKLGTAPTSPGASSYSQPADQSKAMQAEFDDASSHLQSILDNPGAPEAVKQQARAAYNRQQAFIAKKYGATSGGTATTTTPDDQMDDDQP